MLDLLIAAFNLTQLQVLLTAGGIVLKVLAFTALVLWSLLLTKLWFVSVEFPRQFKDAQHAASKKTFRSLISELQLSQSTSMGIIRTTINVCPLLGLMGTVVGMIDIFDVIGASGAANAQIMAASVAKAILPTMAGMVIAISAMFMFAYIQRRTLAQRSLLLRLSLSKSELML